MNSSPQSPRRVRFHDLAVGGEGVGRDESGKTVFAPFSAPGDVAMVAIEAEKPTFARGVVAARDSDGLGRVAPPCPYFRPDTPHHSCGGCAWQHLDITAQREAKRRLVQNVLARIGGQHVEVEGCVGADAFGTRNKADFVVEGERIGFYAAHSHDLVGIEACPIQHPLNQDVLRVARKLLATGLGEASEGAVQRLLARVSTAGEGLVVVSTTKGQRDAARRFASALRERLPHLVGVAVRDESGHLEVSGRDWLVETVNGLEFRVTGDGFWQVNPQLTPLLAQTALDWLAPRPGERVLDLFCGAGLFALHLARAGARVTGIEASPRAIEDARLNASALGLEAQFHASDALSWLKRHKKGDFDAILLDPPRSGAKDAMRHLTRVAPRRIVYVSCDPATLARDGRELQTAGYRLLRARCFDLFPQTAHVETVAYFERQ